MPIGANHLDVLYVLCDDNDDDLLQDISWHQDAKQNPKRKYAMQGLAIALTKPPTWISTTLQVESIQFLL
ncbi:hypothetical protein WISP_102167 [Willisornis vidua]|uniref:Uncharacterized protein n=1 Tax=Willisornis vidua TaxID=1566151 RepID=A0ABQ9CYG9_9PASS|nr:hypothetical protein WISP_102167 [Willisornis vidua]